MLAAKLFLRASLNGPMHALRLDIVYLSERGCRLTSGTCGVAGIAALIGLGLAGVPLQAQTAAAGKPSFEAASIKQSKPGAEPNLRLENDRLTADLTLSGYIWYAYDQIRQIDFSRLPKWVSTELFEIHAVAKGNPAKSQMCLMLQSLLADRFRLQVHIVTAEVPVLALILEKPGTAGPKLRPHSEGPPCDVHLPSQAPASAQATADMFPAVCGEVMAMPKPNGAVLVGARNATMEKIAIFLSALPGLGGQAVDQTGLNGRFDFTLEFTPEAKGSPPDQQNVQADLPATTLQDALHEQLGMKLKATKAPLDTLVVGRAERPSEN
jgi:uncharacterized protein (TIGR03435 family)